jgi:hypothetical protein
VGKSYLSLLADKLQVCRAREKFGYAWDYDKLKFVGLRYGIKPSSLPICTA